METIDPVPAVPAVNWVTDLKYPRISIRAAERGRTVYHHHTQHNGLDPQRPELSIRESVWIMRD